MPAGYSQTPLVKKLGIKAGCRLCAVGAPPDYRDLLSPLPAAVSISDQVDVNTDLYHVFETRKKPLAKTLGRLIKLLKPAGIIWVSWPKKSSQVPSEITEDTVRELALPLGLVDIKVCAVTDVWSGLKLVWRLKNRPKK